MPNQGSDVTTQSWGIANLVVEAEHGDTVAGHFVEVGLVRVEGDDAVLGRRKGMGEAGWAARPTATQAPNVASRPKSRTLLR